MFARGTLLGTLVLSISTQVQCCALRSSASVYLYRNVYPSNLL